MSLLSLSKRILGKDKKASETKKKKVSAAAKKNALRQAQGKQKVDAHALTTGIIGLAERVSEKAINQQVQGTAVFTVLPYVTKTQIAAAVEARFGVKVKSVRTAVAHPKIRRRGITEGKTNRVKKAYVTVDNIASLSTQK